MIEKMLNTNSNKKVWKNNKSVKIIFIPYPDKGVSGSCCCCSLSLKIDFVPFGVIPLQQKEKRPGGKFVAKEECKNTFCVEELFIE